MQISDSFACVAPQCARCLRRLSWHSRSTRRPSATASASTSSRPTAAASSLFGWRRRCTALAARGPPASFARALARVWSRRHAPRYVDGISHDDRRGCRRTIRTPKASPPTQRLPVRAKPTFRGSFYCDSGRGPAGRLQHGAVDARAAPPRVQAAPTACRYRPGTRGSLQRLGRPHTGHWSFERAARNLGWIAVDGAVGAYLGALTTAASGCVKLRTATVKPYYRVVERICVNVCGDPGLPGEPGRAGGALARRRRLQQSAKSACRAAGACGCSR